MTTLVTGATGGFGRLFLGWLRQQIAGPVVATGRSGRTAGEYVCCDLTDPLAVRDLVRRVRPRMVYHLAGSFSNQLDADLAVNALSARYLLEAGLEERLETRFALVGSAAEYGAVSPEENPVGEDRILRPISVYGLTKAFQTLTAGLFATERGADVVVARMFNLIAPGLSDRLFVGRVERLIEKYQRGDVATIEVGNLDHQRDYVSAPDASAQLRLIAEQGRQGLVYHIGSGRPVVMRDVLLGLLERAGVPATAVREGLLQSTGRVGYDAPLIYADMRRTRELSCGTGSQ